MLTQYLITHLSGIAAHCLFAAFKLATLALSLTVTGATPTPPKDQGATGNGTAGCPSIDYVTLLLLLTTPRTTVVQEPWGCSMEAGEGV